jgi:hypothetical protein
VNAVEHIVESYFRLCKKCFTISDVKVPHGNNRQVDLLAVSLVDGVQYHVECSVTHCENWCPTPEKLEEEFERKFLGYPREREGTSTDSTKKKTYGGMIYTTYQIYGFDMAKVRRVWICWVVKDQANLKQVLYNYHMKSGQLVEVLSFRDEILPKLQKAIGTSNYDDEVLRTFSLLKQAGKQGAK